MRALIPKVDVVANAFKQSVRCCNNPKTELLLLTPKADVVAKVLRQSECRCRCP